MEYTLIYNDEGQPLQAVIALSDITEQRRSELVKRKWKQAYTAFPPADMNYYEYNLTQNTFTEMSGEMLPPISQEAQRSLDLAVNELADCCVFPEDGHRFRAFLERERLLDLYESGIRLDRLEFRRLGTDDQPLWTLANLQLSDNPATRDILAYLLLSDEDDAHRKREAPTGNGDHDALTGLSSRASFEKQFAALLEKSEINDVHALVCLDVDGLRRVNDAYGHIFGDRVLSELAASLKTMPSLASGWSRRDSLYRFTSIASCASINSVSITKPTLRASSIIFTTALASKNSPERISTAMATSGRLMLEALHASIKRTSIMKSQPPSLLF